MKIFFNSWHRYSRYCHRFFCNFDKKQSTATSYDLTGILFFSGITLSTTGLGIWQVNRYYEKIDSINIMKKRFEANPIAIEDLNKSTDQDLKGRKLLISGTFDHSKEVLVGLRSAPVGLLGQQAQGLSMNPQGYFVITPLIQDNGRIVFINRGWVAKDLQQWQRPTGKVKLVTTLSSPEARSYFSPENNADSRILLWIEESALLKASNLNDLPSQVTLLEALDDSKNTGISFPAAKKELMIFEGYVTPITHLVYAITWFSLTIFGAFMTHSKFRKPVAFKLPKK